ncbi:hypothetical protein AVEN_171155-1 [Araneus ventricosus]|uniref:Uncharacterized protein n=1 Tax=Araneus ventricosus TaxID=182803 RepID=A0A4Y2F903_ARAVE|nr:hypothetical protein AVEN_171155-1 [Araneus ventricosus]
MFADESLNFSPTRRQAVTDVGGNCPPLAPPLFKGLLRLTCDLLFGRPIDSPFSPDEYTGDLEARLESSSSVRPRMDQPNE